MRRSRSLAMLAGALFAAEASAQTPNAFRELHERARAVERSLSTLRADFVETTESDLLIEPIVESGSLIAARPVRVLLRYEKPERKRLLIDGEELLLIWPDSAQIERVEIARIQKTVDKYFTHASVEDLEGHFAIRVASDSELAGTIRIEMIARRKQIQEGLEQLELWLDDQTLLLRKMRLVYPGGAGSKTIELSNHVVNLPVDEQEFHIDLPQTP